MDRPEPRPRQYYVIEKSVVMRYDDRYEEDQRRSVIVTGEPHRPPHSYYRNTEMSTATRGAYLTPTRAYLAGERDVKATAHGQWDDASRERSPPSRYEHPSRNAFMSMAPETSTRAYLAEERDVKAGSRGQRDDISRERSPPSRYEYQPSRKALMSMAPETTTRAYLAEERDVKASAHGQWDGRPHSNLSRERSPPSRYEQPSRRAVMSMAPSETSTRAYLTEERDVQAGAHGKWDERPHSSLSRERSPPSRSQNEMRTTQRPLLALMWKDSSEPEKVLHSEPQLPTSSGRVLRRRVYQHHDSDDPDDPEPVSNKKAHKGKDDTETLEELATLLSNPKKAATKKNSKRQTRANKKKSIESESEEEEQGAGTSKKVETGPKFYLPKRGR